MLISHFFLWFWSTLWRISIFHGTYTIVYFFFFFYITYENIWEEKFIRVLLQNDLNISIEFLFYIQILWIKRKNILRKKNKNQCSVINYYNKLWNIY